jgi:hypothetical protein
MCAAPGRTENGAPDAKARVPEQPNVVAVDTTRRSDPGNTHSEITMIDVNATHLSLETSVEARQIARAKVVAVHENGSVSARLDGDTREIHCDVLETADGSSLLLAEGEAILVWQQGVEDSPGVVLGRIGASIASRSEPGSARQNAEMPDELVLEAKKSLTIKCGQGSIVLRKDGKILIKGKDLVAHAQRVNRIKGGTVLIN